MENEAVETEVKEVKEVKVVHDLVSVTAQKNTLLKRRDMIKKSYVDNMNANALEICRYTVLSDLLTAGIDVDKYHTALDVIYVQGWWSKAGKEKQSVIEDAVKWFSEGGFRYPDGTTNNYKNLLHYYYGTKDYDSWHGQRSDHEYHYGPRHGHIIFAIGLTDDIRKRFKASKTFNVTIRNDDIQGIITLDERNAVIYFLNNFEKIQAIEENAHGFYESGYKLKYT